MKQTWNQKSQKLLKTALNKLISNISIFAIIAALIIICARSTSKINDLTPVFIIALIVGTFLLAAYVYSQDPFAIDVYRGKTELQITYKVQGLDTLQKDTTVVFK